MNNHSREYDLISTVRPFRAVNVFEMYLVQQVTIKDNLHQLLLVVL